MIKHGLLKIGILAKRTGVHPSAIKYYLTQGLLPKPKKTSRNMAYYDAFCIERIKAIKELQRKLFLPLKVIKKVIQNEGGISNVEDLYSLFNAKGQIFENLTFPAHVPPITRAKLIEQTGISPSDFRSLEEMKLVEQENGLYDEYDVRIAEAVARLRSHGITEKLGFAVKDLEFLKKSVEKTVVQEVKLFTNKLADKLFDDDSARLAREGIEEINSLFSTLNKKFIKKIFVELTEKYRKKAAAGRAAFSTAKTASEEIRVVNRQSI